MGDLVEAEMLAGGSEGIAFAVALISRIATFDGKTLPYEEVLKLPASFLSQILSSFSLEPLISPRNSPSSSQEASLSHSRTSSE